MVVKPVDIPVLVGVYKRDYKGFYFTNYENI